MNGLFSAPMNNRLANAVRRQRKGLFVQEMLVDMVKGDEMISHRGLERQPHPTPCHCHRHRGKAIDVWISLVGDPCAVLLDGT